MRDRLAGEAENAVLLRCPCGKRLGYLFEFQTAAGPSVDAALTVHHKLGRMYRTRKGETGKTEVFVANDDNNAWIDCPACDAPPWNSTRRHLLAIYRKARRDHEPAAYLVALPADEVQRLLSPPTTRSW